MGFYTPLGLFLSKMERINKNHILLFILILAILPYCYLCFFANPSADDFSLSAQAQQNNFLELIYHKYQVRNGRYVSSSLSYLNPIVFNSFSGYKLMSLLLITSVFLSQYFFINQLLNQTSKTLKVSFSFVLLLLFFQNMPIISEGIYWFTGGVIYLAGTSMFLFYIGFLIKVLRNKLNGFWQFVLTLLLFFSCGFNEVLTLLIIFGLGVLSVLAFKHNYSFKKVVLLQFGFACLFAAVLIFSPGNSIRGNSYLESNQFFYSMIYSTMQVGRFTLLWIISIPLLAASILYVDFNKKMVVENNFFKNSFYINRWTSIFLLFAIVFICVFPAYWATGMLGQHRTLNVAYFFFLIMWFVNLTVWFNYYNVVLKRALKWKTYLVCLLLVGICFTGNGYNTLHAIFTGSANSFNKQNQQRFKKLSKTKTYNQKQLILKPIQSKPLCLFTSDITSDPKDWRNQAYNMYFRLDSVEIFLKK
jgi:hypothetical protein